MQNNYWAKVLEIRHVYSFKLGKLIFAQLLQQFRFGKK